MPFKPSVVLEAAGSFKTHPSRRRPGEPRARAVGPPPADLPADARQIWVETVHNCATGVFQSSDREALRIFSLLVAESRRNFATFGARRMSMMIQLMGRFGMSPVDRARVAVEPPPPSGKKTGL